MQTTLSCEIICGWYFSALATSWNLVQCYRSRVILEEMLYRQRCNMLHVSWTDLWICDESHSWRKNRLPRKGFMSKEKCVHPSSEEELWNTRTWREIFSNRQLVIPSDLPVVWGGFFWSFSHLPWASAHQIASFMEAVWLHAFTLAPDHKVPSIAQAAFSPKMCTLEAISGVEDF